MKELRSRLAKVLVLSWALPLLAESALGQNQASPVPYDHWKQNEDTAYTREVAEGSFFEVEVSHTCPVFKLNYVAVKAEAPSTLRDNPPQDAPFDCVAEATPRKLQIPHKAEFGGYIVTLSHEGEKPVRVLYPGAKDGITAANAKAKYEEQLGKGKSPQEAQEAVGIKELHDVRLVISIQKAGFLVDFAGGFTTSWLTDPEFAVRKETVDGKEVQKVYRDRDAESAVRLGFAGFINVHHARFPFVATSFGLGVNGSSQVSFFLGQSFRLGGKASLTGGWNWGSVKRLPNGVAEGQPVSDANALTTLPTRTSGRFFLALTYSFLDPGEAFFKKPFAEPEPKKQP